MSNIFLKPVSVKGKVRLGADRDGGYVVYEKLLDETDVLVTYGVGADVSFEEDFNTRTGQRVLMFDPTIFGKFLLDIKVAYSFLITLRWRTLIKYVFFILAVWRKLKRLRRRGVLFINEGIAPAKMEKYAPFHDHTRRFELEKEKILLKIDIEGNEYAIFSSEGFYDSLCNVDQILVEFHNLKDKVDDLKKILERLSQDYLVIHVHGNNVGGLFSVTGKNSLTVAFPNNIELTLIRKGKLDPADRCIGDVLYPIDGLDFANHPRMSDVKLQFIE